MTQDHEVDGRKRRGELTRRLIRDKVTLALYWISDDVLTYWVEGDVEPIAKAAGTTIGATRRALLDLELLGVILRYLPPIEDRQVYTPRPSPLKGRPARAVILVDEIDGNELTSYLKCIDKSWAVSNQDSIERIRKAIEKKRYANLARPSVKQG